MARTTRPSKKKGNFVTLDFTGVETNGRFREDGSFRMKVVEVTQEQGDKFDYYSWKLQCVEEGDSEGAIVYNNTSLAPQSLWGLRGFLVALGVEIPESEFELDLDELVDLEFIGEIEIETSGEYKGKPRLVDFSEIPEEKPARGGKRGAKKDDEDEKPARASRRGAKKDDEPEEKPARSRRGAKVEEPEPDDDLTEDSIGEMTEDELQDVIDEHKLKVDLDDFPSLRKMRAAVIDAAQEKGVIGDAEPEPEEKPARRRSRR